MEGKKDQDIALFRYKLIAPILNDSKINQMEYFRKMSQKEHNVPYLGRKIYKGGTFKHWLRDYRHGGFDALKPKPRADKGCSRKVDDKIAAMIKDKVLMFPCLSCAAIYRLLICEGDLEPDWIAEATVRKYIKDNKLILSHKTIQPRKKFEKEHINQLWIADVLHGPYILNGKRKAQVFLMSIIDDYSRVIVGANFFHHENSLSLEIILKEAIAKFGLPAVLYCDNGSIFTSYHLQLACARLGIALVHSKPYDSPSRGKIERFFRTIRQKFLPLINPADIDAIELLNNLFHHWLDKEYQKSFHHGIQCRPMDRWINDLSHTSIRLLSSEELDLAFYVTIKRKVKNDATISFRATLYEAPQAFIGKIVEIRFPAENPNQLTIYENNKPVATLKKLNPHENANPPAWGINFNQKKGR